MSARRVNYTDRNPPLSSSSTATYKLLKTSRTNEDRQEDEERVGRGSINVSQQCLISQFNGDLY